MKRRPLFFILILTLPLGIVLSVCLVTGAIANILFGRVFEGICRISRRVEIYLNRYRAVLFKKAAHLFCFPIFLMYRLYCNTWYPSFSYLMIYTEIVDQITFRGNYHSHMSVKDKTTLMLEMLKIESTQHTIIDSFLRTIYSSIDINKEISSLSHSKSTRFDTVHWRNYFVVRGHMYVKYKQLYLDQQTYINIDLLDYPIMKNIENEFVKKVALKSELDGQLTYKELFAIYSSCVNNHCNSVNMLKYRSSKNCENTVDLTGEAASTVGNVSTYNSDINVHHKQELVSREDRAIEPSKTDNRSVKSSMDDIYQQSCI